MSDRHVLVVGGGTAGSVLAARLSEDPATRVTLLEAGADDGEYDEFIRRPVYASGIWAGAIRPRSSSRRWRRRPGRSPASRAGSSAALSAINGSATLRGLPADYDAWGLDGWGWDDVVDTFIAAETDGDFGVEPIHGDRGPLPVRRWRRDELSDAQRSFLDGMRELGEPAVDDINDPRQLPGIGTFPVTIDHAGDRVQHRGAYLTPHVRARDNLTIRTGAEATTIALDDGRAVGVTLVSGESVEADEVIVAAGAIWTPMLLMRSGIGPADQLRDRDLAVHADLPVGATMSDHIGPGLAYQHDGPRGGSAGPAQVVYIGASNGVDPDYHAFPIAPPPVGEQTVFPVVVLALVSSGRGSVRLGDTADAEPMVTAPPLPDHGVDIVRHGLQRVAAWERSVAAVELGVHPLLPLDLTAPDAAEQALERNTVQLLPHGRHLPDGAGARRRLPGARRRRTARGRCLGDARHPAGQHLSRHRDGRRTRRREDGGRLRGRCRFRRRAARRWRSPVARLRPGGARPRSGRPGRTGTARGCARRHRRAAWPAGPATAAPLLMWRSPRSTRWALSSARRTVTSSATR